MQYDPRYKVLFTDFSNFFSQNVSKCIDFKTRTNICQWGQKNTFDLKGKQDY